MAEREPEQPDVPHEQRYLVRPGDNLRKIAEQFYGDPSKWATIRDANRDRFPNPNIVREGVEITIPELR